MADIACVFHWAPESMDPMSLDELMHWHTRAVQRASTVSLH